MKTKSWNFNSGLNVSLHGNTLLWENWRRGCEGGAEQSTQEFIEKGPVFDFNEIPREILREILAELGLSGTSWLPEQGQEKSVRITIQGVDVYFADDPSLRSHNQSFENLVKKYSMSAEEYWNSQTIYCGHLTQEVQLGDFTYQAYTDLYFYENQHVFIGILAKPFTLNTITYPSHSRILFHPDGSIDTIQ